MHERKCESVARESVKAFFQLLLLEHKRERIQTCLIQDAIDRVTKEFRDYLCRSLEGDGILCRLPDDNCNALSAREASS